MKREQRVCHTEESASAKTRRTEDSTVHLLAGKTLLTAGVQRASGNVTGSGWPDKPDPDHEVP